MNCRSNGFELLHCTSSKYDIIQGHYSTIEKSIVFVFLACVNWYVKVSGTCNIPFGHTEYPAKLLKCPVGRFIFFHVRSGNCEKQWLYMISVEMPLSQYFMWIPILYMCPYISIGSSPWWWAICYFPSLNILCRHSVSLSSTHERRLFVFSWPFSMLSCLSCLGLKVFIGCLCCLLLWYPYNTNAANVVTAGSRCMFNSIIEGSLTNKHMGICSA